MNWKAIQSWWMEEGPYAAFWVTSAVAVACLVGAAVGLMRWMWFFLAVAAILGSLRALHNMHQREIRKAYEAEADRMMDRVQKRLQSSHPDGGVTFEEYVKALRAEGVPDAERFAAEYPHTKHEGRAADGLRDHQAGNPPMHPRSSVATTSQPVTRLVGAYTSEQVIATYVKVLQELADMGGLARAPEEVLPLPKGEMESLLQRSTHPKRDELLRLLTNFEPGVTASLFLARLVSRPVILTLAYAVAIAAQGANWLWVPIAALGGVGAFAATSKWAWVDAWPTLPKWKRWLWILLIELGGIAVLICWGGMWVRLVVLSGLYGLYQAGWVRPDGFGIFAALLSLVLGYFFSKQLNAFLFFVMQYTSRRQFRQAPG